MAGVRHFSTLKAAEGTEPEQKLQAVRSNFDGASCIAHSKRRREDTSLHNAVRSDTRHAPPPLAGG